MFGQVPTSARLEQLVDGGDDFRGQSVHAVHGDRESVAMRMYSSRRNGKAAGRYFFTDGPF
jgi:hypothetical protein